MKLIVNPHKVEIIKEPVNEREIDITKCEFEFADEITNNYVKEAYFTFKGTTYKQIIINNQCSIPSEVLTEKGQVELGVVAYLVANEEEIKRYNPSPAYFNTWLGSLKDNAENSEPITPSEMEQYEQALQDGLEEVNSKLPEINQAIEDVNEAITKTNNLDLDVTKEGKTATVTLTKKDATTKTVTLSDGTSLMFNWDGTRLGIKTDEDADYTYVDLQGIQGPIGPKGEAFTIKKTYSSVAEMNADFNNMQLGDYVMIASTVEVEDNAKLYTKGEEQWIFISDFSGAQGIKGETGATPNIQIGTVTSGATPSVTRTGTNENPVLNFTLVKGDKGDTGETGQTGATGNGIASITKTGTSGLVDTYTITYTDGTTSTFEVTNGQDGEVTQEQLDETNAEVERAKMVYNALPKVTGTGTEVTLNDTAKCPMPMSLRPSATSQATSILPDGYTQVDYIESDGSKFINTGYSLQSNQLEIKTKVYIPTLPVSEQDIASNQDNSTNRFVLGVNQSYMFGYSRSGSSSDTNIVTANLTAPNIFEIQMNYDYANSIKSLTVNGVTTTATQNKAISPSNNAIRLLANADGGGTSFKGRLYYLSITDNGVLVRNFIPCYRNSDNEVGMYDTVNGVFYKNGNSNTSSFTYGAVVTLPNPDFPLDIHTVSGNNSITISNNDNTESQTLPLNLGTIELCKIGTYEDYFYKNNNKWYLHKEIGKSTIDGSWNWAKGSLSNTTYSVFQASGVDVGLYIGNTILIFSDKFTGGNNMSVSSLTNESIYTGNSPNSPIRISILNSRLSSADVTGFKSWLTNNNVIAYIPLSTSTNTEITDTTLISQLEAIYNKATSYQDQTNITQVNNDLPFVITASAVRDMSNIFDLISGTEL